MLGPTGGLLVLEVKSRLLILVHPFLGWRFLRVANRNLNQVSQFTVNDLANECHAYAFKTGCIEIAIHQ